MNLFGCSRITVMIFVTASTGCLEPTGLAGGDSGTKTTPTERVPYYLEVDPATLTLDSGQSRTITPRVLDQFGIAFNQIPATVVITWLVADTTIAAVKDGMVTALAPGFTKITVTARGIATATVQLGVVSVGALVSQLRIEYPDDPGRFSIISSFNPETDAEPPAKWADAVYDQASDSWSIRATWRRDGGLRDILEIVQPRAAFQPSGYLLVTLWLGVNAIGNVATAVYSSDPDIAALQLTNVSDARIDGRFEFNVYGGPPSGPATIRLSGDFSVPFVKHHALPAP